MLNDRTNGLENSYLPVPIRTVRAFAQLVYRLQDLIPALESAVSAGNLTKEMLRHYMVMPDLPPNAIQTFKNTYQGSVVTDQEKTRRTARDAAYSEFVRNYVTANARVESPLPLSGSSIAAWITSLRNHFSHDAEAGAAYLVLKANEDWNKLKDSFGDKWISVFDTPLFQPLLQTRGYAQFRAAHELNEWHIKLADLPESWLKQLPEATILPYPVPEIGPLVSSNMMKAYLATDAEPGPRLVAELLLHRNFYTSNKTGAVLCVGRIFEIVITSLLRNMTAADLGTILSRPPFYSFGALAQTKTLESEDLDDDELGEANTEPVELEPELAQFADDINAWRKELKLEDLRLSPWLVYNVMNKFLNQAWLFNTPGQLMSDADAFDRIAWVARKAFNSIWAAFGSFEKGQIYGLPPVIATVNIGEGADFQNSDLYRQNITPFVGAKSGASHFGLRVGAITAMLESHPLKRLTDTLRPPLTAEPKTRVVITGTPRVKKQNVSEWLFEKTGKKQFNAAARQMQNWPVSEVKKALNEYLARYKNTRLPDAYERARQPKGK